MSVGSKTYSSALSKNVKNSEIFPRFMTSISVQTPPGAISLFTGLRLYSYNRPKLKKTLGGGGKMTVGTKHTPVPYPNM